MTKLINWLKKNKLLTLVVVVLFFFALKEFFPNHFLGRGSLPKTLRAPVNELVEVEDSDFISSTGRSEVGIAPVPETEYAPVEAEERLVVEESSVSMVVADVQETSDKVIERAKNIGGYLVKTSLINPEESPFATVTVRVPAENLRSALDYYRSLAIKVTAETIQGTDVTDEYLDIEARLATLEKTKTKFEAIINQATEVQDILDVQRQLIYIQDQIDALKGRQQYLEQTAKLSKITVYLSTDEFALPYAPAETFRPKVIFKLAVRSLVRTFRSVARALIWLGVYAVIWLPVGVIVFFVWRRMKK